MNTIKDFRNDLLKRREIKILINSESNPGFANAVKLVAEGCKAEPERVVVKNLKSKFGRNTFLLDSFVYDSVADKERIEPKVKVKKAAGGSS